jgi:hypothetical protein
VTIAVEIFRRGGERGRPCRSRQRHRVGHLKVQWTGRQRRPFGVLRCDEAPVGIRDPDVVDDNRSGTVDRELDAVIGMIAEREGGRDGSRRSRRPSQHVVRSEIADAVSFCRLEAVGEAAVCRRDDAIAPGHRVACVRQEWDERRIGLDEENDLAPRGRVRRSLDGVAAGNDLARRRRDASAAVQEPALPEGRHLRVRWRSGGQEKPEHTTRDVPHMSSHVPPSAPAAPCRPDYARAGWSSSPTAARPSTRWITREHGDAHHGRARGPGERPGATNPAVAGGAAGEVEMATIRSRDA